MQRLEGDQDTILNKAVEFSGRRIIALAPEVCKPVIQKVSAKTDKHKIMASHSSLLGWS